MTGWPDPASAGGVESLNRLLETFLGGTQANCAVLIDRDGRLITAVGTPDRFDGATFASLAAADFAAGDQLATLLGEEDFKSLYHRGDDRSMYLVDVDGEAILAALFDNRVRLGMIRLRAKDAVPKLAALCADRLRPRGATSSGPGTGWADEAGAEIDRLFHE